MGVSNLEIRKKVIVKNWYSTNLIEAKRELRTENEALERESKGKRGLACRRETWRLEHGAIGRMGGKMLEGRGRR